MTEMVERLSKVVTDQCMGAIYPDHAANIARAVLEALREPTEEMVEAGLTTSSRFGKPAMRNIWQAMTSAAIGGK